MPGLNFPGSTSPSSGMQVLPVPVSQRPPIPQGQKLDTSGFGAVDENFKRKELDTLIRNRNPLPGETPETYFSGIIDGQRYMSGEAELPAISNFSLGMSGSNTGQVNSALNLARERRLRRELGLPDAVAAEVEDPGVLESLRGLGAAIAEDPSGMAVQLGAATAADVPLNMAIGAGVGAATGPVGGAVAATGATAINATRRIYNLAKGITKSAAIAGTTSSVAQGAQMAAGGQQGFNTSQLVLDTVPDMVAEGTIRAAKTRIAKIANVQPPTGAVPSQPPAQAPSALATVSAQAQPTTLAPRTAPAVPAQTLLGGTAAPELAGTLGLSPETPLSELSLELQRQLQSGSVYTSRAVDAGGAEVRQLLPMQNITPANARDAGANTRQLFKGGSPYESSVSAMTDAGGQVVEATVPVAGSTDTTFDGVFSRRNDLPRDVYGVQGTHLHPNSPTPSAQDKFYADVLRDPENGMSVEYTETPVTASGKITPYPYERPEVAPVTPQAQRRAGVVPATVTARDTNATSPRAGLESTLEERVQRLRGEASITESTYAGLARAALDAGYRADELSLIDDLAREQGVNPELLRLYMAAEPELPGLQRPNPDMMAASTYLHGSMATPEPVSLPAGGSTRVPYSVAQRGSASLPDIRVSRTNIAQAAALLGALNDPPTQPRAVILDGNGTPIAVLPPTVLPTAGQLASTNNVDVDNLTEMLQTAAKAVASRAAAHPEAQMLVLPVGELAKRVQELLKTSHIDVIQAKPNSIGLRMKQKLVPQVDVAGDRGLRTDAMFAEAEADYGDVQPGMVQLHFDKLPVAELPEAVLSNPRELARLAGATGATHVVNSVGRDVPIQQALKEAALKQRQTIAENMPPVRGKTNDFSRGVENVVTPFSTVLRRISPALADRISVDFEQSLGRQVIRADEIGQKFFSLVNGLPEAKRLRVQQALLQNKLLPKDLPADVVAAYKPIAALFRDLAQEFHGSKHLKGLGIDNYFPRMVNDYEGLRKTLALPPKVLAALDAKTAKLLANPSNANLEAMADTITALLRSKVVRGVPDSLKERKIDEVSARLQKFYATPEEAYHTRVIELLQEQELRKLFGKHAVLDGQGQSIHLDKSIGSLLAEQVAAGNLNPADIPRLTSLLRDRFEPKAMNSIVRSAKNIWTAALLANPLSALVQLGDLGLSAAVHGTLPTMRAVFSTLRGNGITPEHIGIRPQSIGEEMGAGMTRNFLNTALKLSGFSLMDGFAKRVTLKAILNKATAQSRTATGRAALMERWGHRLQGPAFEQFVDALRKQDYLHPDVQAHMFAEITRTQPITQSELPPAYQSMSNGRVLYSLKSFLLKQLDLARSLTVDEVKRGHPGKAVANATKLAVALAMAGATQEMIVSVFTGEDPEVPDAVVDQMLKLFGANRYILQRSSEGAGPAAQAITGMVAPPMAFALAPFTDTYRYFQDEDFTPESMRYIPLVGRIAHARMREAAKEEKTPRGPGHIQKIKGY